MGINKLVFKGPGGTNSMDPTFVPGSSDDSDTNTSLNRRLITLRDNENLESKYQYMLTPTDLQCGNVITRLHLQRHVLRPRGHRHGHHRCHGRTRRKAGIRWTVELIELDSKNQIVTVLRGGVDLETWIDDSTGGEKGEVTLLIEEDSN